MEKKKMGGKKKKKKKETCVHKAGSFKATNWAVPCERECEAVA